MSPLEAQEVVTSAEQTRDLPLLARAFARHETFHLRYGWLKKGFDLACEDNEGFLSDHAAVRLGVGKNMVRAIRYWCRAFKLTAEVQSPDRPRMYLDVPTPFGLSLMGDTGWDPFLENPASIWLLHWQLLQPTCYAPTWYAVFNGIYLGSVSDETLYQEAALLRDAHPAWSDVVDASLRKDVDCLLRMYAPRRRRGATLEDSLDSPLSTLRLILPIPSDRHAYRFNVGPKDGLSDEVIVLAMMQHLVSRGRSAAGTAMLSGFVYDEASPGRVFKLAESDLRDAVRGVSAQRESIELVDVAGSMQVVLRESPVDLADELLASIYSSGDQRV